MRRDVGVGERDGRRGSGREESLSMGWSVDEGGEEVEDCWDESWRVSG